MYVAKVKLENIRGFHDARRVDLDFTRPDRDSPAGLTVLVGPNGSGRTTLLRTIALALAGPDQVATLAGNAASWVSVGHERGGVELDLTGDVYLGLGLSADGIETESNAPFPTGQVFAGYGPFRRFSGGISLPRSRFAGLFREDVALSDGLSWLIGLHLQATEKRPGAAEVRDAALAVLADGLFPDGDQVSALDAEGLWVTHAQARLPLRELGDAYRSTAALVVDLLKQVHAVHGSLPLHPDRPAVTAPGVVLIDELEAHLHPRWQQGIGGWLKDHFPGVQFVVTTNSPYVAQAADPHGLIRLPGPHEQAAAHVVSEDLYRRVIFGSGEDVVLSDLFGLPSPYSGRARALRNELVELELRVLDGHASDIQLARYLELQELLVSSPAARAAEIEARLAREKARRGNR